MRRRIRVHPHCLRAPSVPGIPRRMLPQHGQDPAGSEGGCGCCQCEGTCYEDCHTEGLVSVKAGLNKIQKGVYLIVSLSNMLNNFHNEANSKTA